MMWLGLLAALCLGLAVPAAGVRLVLVSAVVLVAARNLARWRERSLLRREVTRTLSSVCPSQTDQAVSWSNARTKHRKAAGSR